MKKGTERIIEKLTEAAAEELARNKADTHFPGGSADDTYTWLRKWVAEEYKEMMTKKG